MTAATTGETPQEFPKLPETLLSDRELLVHILFHAENSDARLGKLEELIDRLSPLIDMVSPGGKPPDAISAGQTARAMRRGMRGRHHG